MNKYFEKLEIKVIINQLISYAVNSKVKENLKNLQPSSEIDKLNDELTKIEEFLNIIIRFDRPAIQIEGDLDQIIRKSNIQATLSSLELYEVVKLDSTIKSALHLKSNLQKEKISAPAYYEIVDKFEDFSELTKMIKKAIDYDGSIFDDASPRLKQIRQSLKTMDGRIKSKLNEIIVKEGKKLSEPLIVLRDNAYCLPVRSEYKNSIKGIVHDTSASMQTFYIEPAAVMELNLQKEQLINDEYEEINIILANLSNMVNTYSDILELNFQLVKQIDYFNAKALLAKSMNAVKPILKGDGHFKLVNARHPLLKVTKVIPNTIDFQEPALGMIITGPNTGGKTVLLKTVGLLALMVKFGLLIPCDQGSSIMIFDQIFCDIGDDQSISMNLSTFSSHLSSIIDIINHTTNRSLILFDEIGAGTDPLEGSSLAIAILKYLLKEKISFITTTHYSELKIFGFNDKRIINASMEFDEKTLTPTYRLLLGVTGSSNAFNIASRMGLKTEIIEEAKSLMDKNSDEKRKMIEQYEKKSLLVSQLESKLQEEVKLNQQIKTDYEQKIQQLSKEKEMIIRDAEKTAENIIRQAQYDAKQMIDKIELTSKTNPKLHEIAALKYEINSVEVKKEPPIKVNPNYQYHLGDDVYVPAYDQYGVIEKISNNKYEVSIGNMHINLKKNDLQPAQGENVTTNLVKKYGKDEVSKSTKKVSMTLDLRGKRYVDAQDELERFIDDLVLMGLKQGTIIHGFGTGTIRNLVQDFVKRNNNIKEYRYGGEKEGGLGVTVITLK